MGETEIERLVVKIIGDNAELIKSLTESAKKIDDTAKAAEKSAKGIEGYLKSLTAHAKGILGVLGMVGIAGTLGAAYHKYVEAEKGQRRLNAAIEAGGHAVGPAMDRYNAFAKEIGKNTLVTRGQTMALLQQAESMGYSGAVAERMVKNSVALAAAKGGEATEYIRAAMALETGNTQMLKYSLGLRGLKDDTQVMKIAQGLLTSGMKIAEEEAKTAEGQMEKLGRAFGSMTREVGGMVATVLTPLVTKLSEGVERFNSLGDGVKKATIAAVGLLLVVPTLAFAIEKLQVAAMFTAKSFIALANPVTLVAAAAVALAGAVVLADHAYQDMNGQLSRYNANLAETSRLHKGIVQSQQTKTQNIVAGANAMADPADRMKALRDARVQTAEEMGRLAADYSNVYQRFRDAQAPAFNLVERAKKIALARSDLNMLNEVFQTLQERMSALNKEIGDKGPWTDNQAVVQKTKELFSKLKDEFYTFDLSPTEKELRKLEEAGVPQEILDMARSWEQGVEAKRKDKKAAEEQAEAVKKLNEEYTAFMEEMSNTINTAGMSADEVKLFHLQMKGLPPTLIDAAREMIEFKRRQEEMDKSMQRMIDRGQELYKETRTPLEQFNDKVEELNRLVEVGAIDMDTYGRAVDKAEEQLNSATKTADKLTGKLDAVAFNSVEATRTVNEFLDGPEGKGKGKKKWWEAWEDRGPGQTPINLNVPGGNGTQGRYQDQSLEYLRRIAESTEPRMGGGRVLVNADLGGSGGRT